MTIDPLDDDLTTDSAMEARLPLAVEQLLRNWDLPEKTDGEWEVFAEDVEARIARSGSVRFEDWVLEAPLPPGVLRARTDSNASRTARLDGRFRHARALAWSGFAAAAAIAVVVGLRDPGKPSEAEPLANLVTVESNERLNAPAAPLPTRPENPAQPENPARPENGLTAAEGSAPLEISQLPELEAVEVEPDNTSPSRLAVRRAARALKPVPREEPAQPHAEQTRDSAKPEPKLVPAADGVTFPDRPSLHSVKTAVDPHLATARTCGISEPTQVTLVFSSDGQVRSVRFAETVNGTPAAACIRRALSQARVKPFSDESFGVRVWLRP